MDFTEEEIVTVEVVFAIEATANLISHWDGIKKHYITPIMQHFNKKSGSHGDFLSNSNESMFGLVLFYTADKTPDSLTDCFPMTTNQQQFIKLVDSIDFTGGGAEHHSYVAEGLATVLQLFDDMAKAQKNKKVERFCFLVCNTPPYELPSSESLNYSGLSWKELLKKLKNIDVKFSIICPQLMKELKQMFLLVNDSKAPMMNYAQDKRHLVLLTGLHIKLEKEPNPLVDGVASNEIQVKSEFVMPMEISTPATEQLQVSSAAITGISNVKSEPVTSFSQPALPQPSPSSTLITSANTVTNIPAPVSQLNAMFSSSSMSNVSQESAVTSNIPSAAASTVTSTRPNTVPSVNLSKATGQIADAHNKSQIDQKVMPIVISVNPVDAGTTSSVEANSRLLWTGNMEWTEKRSLPPGTTITHSVPCQITQNPSSSNATMVDPMMSSNWLSKLTIQFIPSSFISQTQQLHSYLKVHKNVVLNFPPQQMQQMVAIFTKKNVHGLIQHLSQPDGKLMIVFHKRKDDKSSFFGLIPNDHAGFLKVLRSVVFNVKRRTNPTMSSQIDSGQNMNQSIMQPNTVAVQDMGVNPGMQMHPQQPQQQYQFTNQPLVGQSNPQQQRLNQPMNTGLNMPGSSQSHLNIRPSQTVQTIRPNIRAVGATTNTAQLRGNQTGLTGNMGQRIIAGTTLSMPGGARTGLRMQQINSIGGTTTLTGNRQMAQGSQQLRNLLGHGNTVMQTNNMGMRQQDNSGLRPTGANNMQQQNFMQNPNMMSGMQNQGNF